MTNRAKSKATPLLAACALSIAALAAWAAPLDPPLDRSQVAGVAAPTACGDGVRNAGEACDDGGACLGGTNEGDPCTGADDCPNGDCLPFGGDGCAANCTVEAVHRLAIDPTRSSVEFVLPGLMTISPLVAAGLARVAVTAGGTGDGGVIPVAVPSTQFRLAVDVTQVNECVCLRALDEPAAGPGNAGAGSLACGSSTLDGNDIVVRRDHDISDVDPSCQTGTPDALHPGACNGPETIDVSAPGPPGSALISVRTQFYEIPGSDCSVEIQSGVCSPGSSMREWLPCVSSASCGDGECVPAKGADGIPCTDDDPTAALAGVPVTTYLTTGMARGEVLDAGGTHGFTLVTQEASGAPFTCAALAGEPVADASAVILAGAFSVIDHSALLGGLGDPLRIDLAAALRLAFLPEVAGGGVCGNGAPDPGEECDDGNAVDGDGCDWNCTPSRCGNGLIAAGEECDDGNADAVDGCTDHCTVCGNDVVSPPEECDDGNLANGDGCDANCTIPRCGNGVATDGEACDDGNAVNGDGCDVNCTLTGCGNGVVGPGEECDDGNTDPLDGCDPVCRLECGNRRLDPGELCDDGNQVDGDGCDSNCTWTGCGNGIVTAGEECDDGNGNPFDGCTNDCTVCGNGSATGREQCDDGNRVATDGCTTACTICGDGRVAAPERCDDGNHTDGDGCDSSCTPSGCGNGVVAGDEQCDDGGICVGGDRTGLACVDALECPGGTCAPHGGDGCSVTCTIERRQRLQLDPDRSLLELQPGGSPFSIPLPLSGSLVLTAASPRAGGEVALVVHARDWHLDPVVIPFLGCVCLEALDPGADGSGAPGSGTVWCGTEGGNGIDVTTAVDHDTGDVDPACLEGHREVPTTCVGGSCGDTRRACLSESDCPLYHDGLCNGPTTRTFSGSGPQGSALLELRLATRACPSGGTICVDGERAGTGCRDARDCPGGTCTASNGPDGIPCTADDPRPEVGPGSADRMRIIGDPGPGNSFVLPSAMEAAFTSGTARATISDVDAVPGHELTLAATGVPFTCQTGAIDFRAGGTLVAAVPSLDNTRFGDDVAAFVLGLESPCPGDCDGDGAVTIAELVGAVTIALGTSAAEDCEASDADADGAIRIHELIAAVRAALDGCGAPGLLPGEPLPPGTVAVVDDERLSVLQPDGRELWARSGLDLGDRIGAWRALSLGRDGRLAVVCSFDSGTLSAFEASGEPTFTRAGNCFAVDTADDRIYVLTSQGPIEGDELHVLTRDGEVIAQAAIGAVDLVVDPARGVVWTVGVDVKKVDLASLAVLSSIDPIAYTGVSVDLAADGSVWIAERRHPDIPGSQDRLLQVAADGSLAGAMALDTIPYCLRVDRGPGNIWVATFDGVRKYSAAGDEELRIDVTGARSLDVDQRDHSVWVGSANDLYHYSSSGSLLARYPGRGGRQVAVFSGVESSMPGEGGAS